MTSIPGKRPRRFYERKAVVELLAVVPPVVTAAVTALVNLRDPERRALGWLLVAAIAWLVAFAASRQSDDYEQFLAELVRNWSYTEDDARKLSPDRRSWMAVPVFGDGPVPVAVVYLDSNDRTFFTTELQQVIVEASSGITSYVSEAYR